MATENPLISICMPCKNRTYDLKKTIPFLIESIEKNSDIELLVLDYTSEDDCEEYMHQFTEMKFSNGSFVTYAKNTSNSFFHMAHAKNVAILKSKGRYAVSSNADIYFDDKYFEIVKKYIADGYQFIKGYGHQYSGIVTFEREAFIASGGYDERFELYGPEDKELRDRLLRRGVRVAELSSDLIKMFYTPDDIKVKNYSHKISKHAMHKLMVPYYKESIAEKIMIANKGKHWGGDKPCW